MLFGLYIPLNSLRVSVDSTGVTVRRAILGLGSTTHIHPDEIVGLHKKVTMQSTSGNNPTVHYALHLKTSQGRKLTLAEGLDSATAANYVGGLIKRQLGGRVRW